MQANEALAAGSAERDLYHETHCKLRSSAAVGYVRYLHLNIVPRRGTDASRMMLRMMIVGPALRNQGMVMSAYPTAALLRILQWVSDEYVSHRDTVLSGVSAMGGCVAMARRRSLLSLPRQLVNCNELQVPRSGTYIMKPTASCGAAQLWAYA